MHNRTLSINNAPKWCFNILNTALHHDVARLSRPSDRSFQAIIFRRSRYLIVYVEPRDVKRSRSELHRTLDTHFLRVA